MLCQNFQKSSDFTCDKLYTFSEYSTFIKKKKTKKKKLKSSQFANNMLKNPIEKKKHVVINSKEVNDQPWKYILFYFSLFLCFRNQQKE